MLDSTKLICTVEGIPWQSVLNLIFTICMTCSLFNFVFDHVRQLCCVNGVLARLDSFVLEKAFLKTH